jgi:hypothetical protein
MFFPLLPVRVRLKSKNAPGSIAVASRKLAQAELCDKILCSARCNAEPVDDHASRGKRRGDAKASLILFIVFPCLRLR